jgi:hypothetical protein
LKKETGKAAAVLAAVILAAALVAGLLAGCGSGGGQARQMVDEGLQEMEEARPILQDLRELNSKIPQLGERYNNLQDTMTEGMSLVRLVSEDLDRLEWLLLGAEGIFREAASMSSGDYSTYAGLAEVAVQVQLEALHTNRDLVSTLADLLSLVGIADSTEQLQYYVEELDRLYDQLEQERLEVSRLAAEADAFYEERNL